MTTSPAAENNAWGYLDLETGEYISWNDPSTNPESFMQRFQALNSYYQAIRNEK